MKVDLTEKLNSSFLSCEKDYEMILRKLFLDNRPHSDELKKLLIINSKDCLNLEKRREYKQIVDKYSVADLIKNHYIMQTPRVKFGEHEEVKSFIIVSFDDFTPNKNNPEFRDCTISFDVLCQTDTWELGGGAIRPLKICGYIDGILNKSKLSGIGQLTLSYCSELPLSAEIGLAGYTLAYRAIHHMSDKGENFNAE